MRRILPVLAPLAVLGLLLGVSAHKADQTPAYDKRAAEAERRSMIATGYLKAQIEWDQAVRVFTWTKAVNDHNLVVWNLTVAENQRLEAERQAAEAAARARASRGAQSRGTTLVAGSGCNPAGIVAAESKGDIHARNPSGAAGKYQFMPGTWAGYGGYSSADQAPESVQDAKFAEVWAGGAGASHWAASVC